jgi:hypothetical protein
MFSEKYALPRDSAHRSKTDFLDLQIIKGKKAVKWGGNHNALMSLLHYVSDLIT